MWQITLKRNKDQFRQHYIHYLMEAFGLAIFMLSACFFAGQLWHPGAALNTIFTTDMGRNLVMGLAMGLTALLIFYSPLTAPSGSHINPAVTLVQWYLGNISLLNAACYAIFQLLGGTAAVYLMSFIMKDTLAGAPVHYAITVPGTGVSELKAALYEIITGFIMITVVLQTGAQKRLKKYTRVLAASLVCIYVMVAGPVSGFGMNPARSLASAIPSGIYTSFWIYLFCPVAGMMAAALLYKKLSLYKSQAV
jgi:aquaporin Z